MNVRRIEYLDFLKGMAIVTVVIGHIIQSNIEGDAATHCFNFIYSFHMGFFFFLSGCTAALSYQRNQWNSFKTFLYKKTLQLLIPFFVWGVILALTTNGVSIQYFPHRLFEICKDPSNRAPWFIFELFFIQLIFFFCCALSKNRSKYFLWMLFVITIPLVSFAEHYISQNIGGFMWVHHIYMLLFISGHIIQSIDLRSKFAKPIAFMCLLLFVELQPSFDFFNPSFKMSCIKAIVSLAFSVCAYISVRYAYNEITNQVKFLFNKLGLNSLEIYLTHFPIIAVFSAPWLKVDNMRVIPLFFIILIIAIPVSYIVTIISDGLKRIPYLSILLYGKPIVN